MFDYNVTYVLDGQVKDRIIILEDYIDSDFVLDFLCDEIEEHEECSDFEIINFVEMVDRSINVFEL